MMQGRSVEAQDVAVRCAVYERAVASGRVPSSNTVAADLALDREQVLASFERLAQAHVLVLQPESREILMANPFSALPTEYLVRVDERSWWGNCAWDALGILAMVGEAGQVIARCPDCGEGLELRVERDQVRSGRSVLAHFAVPARSWWDDIAFT